MTPGWEDTNQKKKSAHRNKTQGRESFEKTDGLTVWKRVKNHFRHSFFFPPWVQGRTHYMRACCSN